MEVFIIALSKDQIVVWLATAQNQYTQQIFLFATPYGRMKDFSMRLQAAYAKKVRGNRLEDLNLNALDSSSEPFALEYIANLFRIADLSGFGASFPIKANLAQTQALSDVAKFLKEMFSDCQYIIRYDVKSFRSSMMNNWLKKNTLNAKLDPIVKDASLELQTATLLAGILGEDAIESQEQYVEVVTKLKSHLAMAPKWKSEDSCQLYLELFDTKYTSLLKQILKKEPRLMFEGLAEKWLKKQIDLAYLEVVLKCLELDGGVDIVLSSSINRLPIEYERLLESIAKTQYTYDLDEFENWVAQYDQVAKTQLHEPIDLGLKTWQKSIEQAMDIWIENPNSAHKSNIVYFIAQDEKYVRFKFESLSYTKQLFEQLHSLNSNENQSQASELLIKRIKSAIEVEEGYLKDLDQTLIHYSAQYVLPDIYCSTAMHRLVMKVELIQNRFIPCYVMDETERIWINQLKEELYPHLFESLTKTKDIQNEMDDLPNEFQEASEEQCKEDEDIQHNTLTLESKEELPVATAKWFKSDIHKRIDEDSLKLLAKSNLSPSQIRLVGVALAKGLKNKLFIKLLHQPDLIHEVLISYLFNSRKQRWFKQQYEIRGSTLPAFYFQPNLSVSKLEAIANLEQAGCNEHWLKSNLKGNMTLAQIEQLKTIYPYGKLPLQYSKVIQIPTSVKNWMIEQANQKHPQMSEEFLSIQLVNFNEQLLEKVLQEQK